MFKDDLITEQFKRDVFKKIEAGEITQEEVAQATTVDASECCAAPFSSNVRCSVCQKQHHVQGTEFVIDQDNRLHLLKADGGGDGSN